MPRSAGAFYFPEHVAIAQDAVRKLPHDVRVVLQRAAASARKDGVVFCTQIEAGLEDVPRTRPLRTPVLHAERGVDCVPFTSLAALAGDHADGVSELRRVVMDAKARELVTAAAFQWRRFHEALERAQKAPLERMAFVHELDVAYYFMDPGYELRAQKARAHFVDAGRSLPDVVRNVTFGAVDNAVAQVLIHHLRSLQLALRHRPTEALLEHGFAVHFLEDAFSSGHLVMTDETWAKGNARTRGRHDFFDAKGLRVERALAAEPCASLASSFERGAAPCWTTWGDGYLGLHEEAVDRAHVSAAVTKLQIQLALALDPAHVQAWYGELGDRERTAFADLLDPTPWWTLSPAKRRDRTFTTADADRLVAGAVAAVDALRESALLTAVDVGMRPEGPVLSTGFFATALDPCVQAPAGEGDDPVCGAGRRLALGAPGASLVRPLLVELPAAVDDPSRLAGQAPADHGLAFQLLGSVTSTALFPRSAPVDLVAPGLGVSMGLAYRFGTYLPGRRNRAAAELNAGITTALHVDATGAAGGHPYATMLEQELRWPFLWEALTSYRLPLDLPSSDAEGSIIALGGARVREVLTDPSPRFWGVELEILAVALSRGAGAYPLYSVSPELRAHVGFADAGILQPSLAGMWAPTVSLTLAGGYATLF